MQVQTSLGYPIGKENARRRGDTMYDGTGAGAATFILGLPLGFVSTVLVASLGWGARKIIKKSQNKPFQRTANRRR